jgi:mRNA-degrading endonuclease toxin of MazEF toxin-antitoxin module
MVRVPPVLNSGLDAVMAADALQVRSVSTARLKTRLGSLPERVTAQVAAAVSEVIG